MPNTTTPQCTCGYDLSGLEGPPWQCPECAVITLQRPPDPPLVTLETRLLAVMKWAAIVGIIFILLTFVARTTVLGPFAFGATMLSCVVFSVAHARWMMIGRRGWAFAEAILLCMFVAFESATLCFLVFVLIAFLIMV